MKKYTVTVRASIEVDYHIEAASIEDAEDRANSKFDDATQFADLVDIDTIDVTDIEDQ